MSNKENRPDNISSEIHYIDSLIQRYRSNTHLAESLSRLKSNLSVKRAKLPKKNQFDLFDNSPYGIFILDENGKYLDVNKVALSQLSYSKNELLRLNLKDVMARSGPDQNAQTFDELKKKKNTGVEILFRNRNGHEFFMSVKIIKITDKIFVAYTEDIDRQKAIELALVESETKNKALSEVANEAIFFTEKGYIVECNEAASKILGYDRNEIIGKFGTVFSAPETLDILRNNMMSGYDKPYEATIVQKDGSKVPVEIQGKMYRYKGQDVRVAIVKDLSYHKRAEKELKEKEEKLKLFADHTNDLVWTIDRNLNYTYISPSVIRLLGYTSEAFLGKHVTFLLTEDSKKIIFETLRKIADNVDEKSGFQASAKLEVDFVHRNNSIITFEVLANALFTESKEIEFFTGVSRDITQRKKNDEKLQQAADILNNIGSGIYLYHLENIEDDRTLRLIAANPSSTSITGLEIRDILGKTIDECFPSFRRLGLVKKYAEVIRTRQPATFDSVEYYDEKKGNLHLSLKAFPLPNNCIGISFENISKLIKTQKELQDRNSELNHFVYKVSHDLRAPLASVKGLLNLAKYGSDSELYLSKIEDSIDKLDHFIRNVLSHSRNLNTTPIVDEIDFEVIINQCLTELNYLPGIEALEKEIHISSGKFHNDSVRIFEIFRNIISNAIKYQDKEKETSIIRINIGIMPNEAKIEIKDNGIGIEKNHLDHVFNMFYRATEISDGSGIGLYIVYQAIKKLNGQINIISTYGEGTTFKIALPNLIAS